MEGQFMVPGIAPTPADRNADVHPFIENLSKPSQGGKEDSEGRRGCLNRIEPLSNSKNQAVNIDRSTTEDVAQGDTYKDDVDFMGAGNPLVDPYETGYNGLLSTNESRRSLMEAYYRLSLPPYQSPQERHRVGNFNKIVQAKLQAREASRLAASQISHSQSKWTQLSVQNSSGVDVNEEVNIASAVVAASSSAVKDIAAVSEVASDVSLQSKTILHEYSFMAMNKSSPKLAELVGSGPNGCWDGRPISSELFPEITNKTEEERASVVEDERIDMSGDHRNVQPSFEMPSQENNIKRCSLVEGDAPQRMRTKLAIGDAEPDPAIEARSLLKHKRNVQSLKPKVWRPKPLSAKEKLLTREERCSTNSNKRTGAQKDLTEFVELSKHGFAGNSYSGNTRLQEPTSNGLNNVSKVYTKRKREVECKPMENDREAHKISEGNLSLNSIDGVVHLSENVETSVTQEENISEICRQETLSLLNSPSKRNASSFVEASPGRKGKVASSGEKVRKSVSDASEPRRSNRKVQPTCRLLEGLQTFFFVEALEASFMSDEKRAKARYWGKSSRDK